MSGVLPRDFAGLFAANPSEKFTIEIGDIEMGKTSDEIPMPFYQNGALFLARFCTSAWIGAASLYVVVGVIEVTRGGFDSTTKDALVSIRFPPFYAFGVSLIGLSWIGSWFSGPSIHISTRRQTTVLALLSVVFVLMVVDYVWIYQPLLTMVTPPGQPKPSSFVGYHQASKWINLAGLLFCSIATFLLNWPAIAFGCVNASRPATQPHQETISLST